MGKQASIIHMTANNTPIIVMGGSGSGNMHSWAIKDLQLDYTTSQSGNALSNCIQFAYMGYEGQLRNITFGSNCNYGIQVTSGIGCPWGCSLDDLLFGGYGGAIDMTGGINATPNNHWGRFYVNAANMVGPIFKNIRGYNWTWATCEIISANQGAQLITFAQGSMINIGAIKLEIGSYGAASNGLALIQGNGSDIEIGQYTTMGDASPNQLVFNAAGDVIYLIGNNQFTGGYPGKVKIRMIQTGWTATAGSIYIFGPADSTTSTGQYEVDIVRQAGTQLTNSVSGAVMEVTKVRDFQNDHVSSDLGDANYTVTLGDPNIATFDTSFTAQRTLTLPSTPQNLFNGLYYEFAFAAGTLTSFGAVVKYGSTITLLTIGTQTTGLILRFSYRRNTPGWVLTKYETGLPL
jgi:hypothetical protein